MPLRTVRDDVIVSRRGELTIGWELTLPVAYSLSEEEYDAMILRYCEAVKRLPDWTLVHRQDVYLKRRWEAPPGERWRKSFLQDSSDRHFDSREYLTHRAFLWLTASGKASLSRKGRDSGYFGFRFLADMPSEERIREFAGVAEEFISTAFSADSVTARRLTAADLEGEEDGIGIIQLIASFGDPSPVMTDYEEGRDFVQYRDHRALSFSLSQGFQLPTEVCTTSVSGSDPESALFLSFAAPIGTALQCEHIVNHYMTVPPQDDTIREMNSRMARMTSGITSSDNRVNAAEIGSYIDDVNRLGLFTVRCSVNVIAWDALGRQQELRSLVSSALSAMKVQAVYNQLDTPLLWYASIPGAGAELGSENYMPMELLSSLCLTPWETFETGLGEGVLRLADRYRHVPVTIDTQVTALQRQLITNYNACVLGASGSGKSFFMNLYMRSCYDRGEHVCIIDVGDSYEGLCSLIREESGGKDGMYYSWDSSHPFSFNPFVSFYGDGTDDNPGWFTAEGTIRQDQNGVNFILSFLMTAYSPKEGWNQSNTEVVVSMLERFGTFWKASHPQQSPIFEDFYTFVNNQVAPRILHTPQEGEDDDTLHRKGYYIGASRVTESTFDIGSFVIALKAYSLEGRYGFLLNDRSPRDLFSSRFTVFEVDSLSKDGVFYPICILCIMNAFEEKMRRERAFKVLAIDEAWKAIDNRSMAPYLAGLWKTSRKYRVSGMVVTQQISDILSSEIIRDTLLQNSAVKILLDQRSNRGIFPQMREMLGLSAKESRMALSVGSGVDQRYGRYREVFLKLGDRFSGVYSVESSPEEVIAYESDKIQKRPYLDLGEKIGYKEAIRELIDQRR